jgi:hypothetical protein
VSHAIFKYIRPSHFICNSLPFLATRSCRRWDCSRFTLFPTLLFLAICARSNITCIALHVGINTSRSASCRLRQYQAVRSPTSCLSLSCAHFFIARPFRVKPKPPRRHTVTLFESRDTFSGPLLFLVFLHSDSLPSKIDNRQATELPSSRTISRIRTQAFRGVHSTFGKRTPPFSA